MHVYKKYLYYLSLLLATNNLANQIEQHISELSPLQQKEAAKTLSSKPGNIIDNLNWHDIAQQEDANCAYHALNNGILAVDFIRKLDLADVANHIAALENELKDFDIYQNQLAFWIAQIYRARKNNPNSPKNNQGKILTNWLTEDEMQNLLHMQDKTFTDHIIMLTDITLNQANNPEFLTDQEKTSINRLKAFQQNTNDYIVVLWTNANFNHWVAYLAIKFNNQIYIYTINSIPNLIPTQQNNLMQLLSALNWNESIQGFLHTQFQFRTQEKALAEEAANQALIAQILAEDAQAATPKDPNNKMAELRESIKEEDEEARRTHSIHRPKTTSPIKKSNMTKRQTHIKEKSIGTETYNPFANKANSRKRDRVVTIATPEEELLQQQEEAALDKETAELLEQFRSEHEQAKKQQQVKTTNQSIDPATKREIERILAEDAKNNNKHPKISSKKEKNVSPVKKSRIPAPTQPRWAEGMDPETKQEIERILAEQ